MIDWDHIDTVLLDMDGTLLDLHFDNYFWMQHLPRVYAEKHGMSEEASRDHLHGRFHAGQGTLDWYSLDYWSEQLDMDILLDVTERMREQKMAPVLAAMDPEKAKSLTVELATRRRLPETGAKSE